MKIIEKLNAYEEKIIITVIVKRKDHKKTQEEMVMDKHLLAERLEKCIKIKDIDKKERY